MAAIVDGETFTSESCLLGELGRVVRTAFLLDYISTFGVRFRRRQIRVRRSISLFSGCRFRRRAGGELASANIAKHGGALRFKSLSR